MVQTNVANSHPGLHLHNICFDCRFVGRWGGDIMFSLGGRHIVSPAQEKHWVTTPFLYETAARIKFCLVVTQ